MNTMGLRIRIPVCKEEENTDEDDTSNTFYKGLRYLYYSLFRCFPNVL